MARAFGGGRSALPWPSCHVYRAGAVLLEARTMVDARNPRLGERGDVEYPRDPHRERGRGAHLPVEPTDVVAGRVLLREAQGP